MAGPRGTCAVSRSPKVWNSGTELWTSSRASSSSCPEGVDHRPVAEREVEVFVRFLPIAKPRTSTQTQFVGSGRAAVAERRRSRGPGRSRRTPESPCATPANVGPRLPWFLDSSRWRRKRWPTSTFWRHVSRLLAPKRTRMHASALRIRRRTNGETQAGVLTVTSNEGARLQRNPSARRVAQGSRVNGGMDEIWMKSAPERKAGFTFSAAW